MEVKGVRIKVLGKGSYGVVHLVKTMAPVPDQFYAVKSADEAISSSIREEQEILQQFIGCPNIVQSFGGFTSVQRDQGKVYNLFLEYAAGGSLSDLMKKYGGQIPERDAKCYARMILQGLVYIHRKGFIHSDLKPDNILVFPPQDGIGLDTLKIADFGLVKQYGVKDTRVWAYGFCGTAAYMSPESLLGEVSGALDVWSLGCVIVQMITGRLPMVCRNLKDLRDKLLSGELPHIPENMSIMGKDFLMKCFARNPNERWTAIMLLNHPYFLSEENLFSLRRGFQFQQLTNSSLAPTNFQEKKVLHSPPGFSRSRNNYSPSLETRKFLEELNLRLQLRRKIRFLLEEEGRRLMQLCI
ncbi:hypothetical protein REPUB_Repub04eG0042400 [Reevesia pubescens]